MQGPAIRRGSPFPMTISEDRERRKFGSLADCFNVCGRG
ncbi:hypothetical protein CP8484711_0546 [Chlamydia psittaci 84-8471/1]|nr:hypothetical protein CP8484711_0546 [Chlamydia psittaci 84-8471/1]